MLEISSAPPQEPLTERNPPGSHQALAILAVATFLSMTTWFSASAVVPQLTKLWRISAGDASWLTIAVQVGFVAGALLSAVMNLSDRVNPRRVFFISSFGAAMANACLTVFHSMGPGIMLRACTGLFLAGVYPPGLKIMATWFKHGRGLALGILIGALTLGSATPQLINGLGTLPWQTVILSTSVLTALGGLLVGCFLRDGPYPFPRGSFDPAYVLRSFQNRRVRLANFGYFGHMWELYSMWSWFGAFFAASLSAGAYHGNVRLVSGAGTFAVIGVGAAGAALAGNVADRIGRPLVAALSLAVSGTCSLVIGLLFGHPFFVLLLGLVWGFAVVADSAQFSAMVIEAADQAYVGTVLTVQLSFGFLLTTVTIRLIPTLVNIIGWHAAFSVLAIGPALGIIAMVKLRACERTPGSLEPEHRKRPRAGRLLSFSRVGARR